MMTQTQSQEDEGPDQPISLLTPSPSTLQEWAKLIFGHTELNYGLSCMNVFPQFVEDSGLQEEVDQYTFAVFYHSVLIQCRCWLNTFFCGQLGYTLTDKDKERAEEIEEDIIARSFRLNLDRNVPIIVIYSLTFLVGVLGKWHPHHIIIICCFTASVIILISVFIFSSC